LFTRRSSRSWSRDGAVGEIKRVRGFVSVWADGFFWEPSLRFLSAVLSRGRSRSACFPGESRFRGPCA
ncbi:hypothetical protein SRHO_G00000080, partial [Serrasalmus rhombeus]